ncbi:hypothetical protein [Paracidovorax avenae]|uniref:hypothetical protein n=1 Tax=Paracidovorax avenae TaxID=80867 RepID=UPI000FE1E4BA|nr:hypothetical protein [Paracidovorax avenae]
MLDKQLQRQDARSFAEAARLVGATVPMLEMTPLGTGLIEVLGRLINVDCKQRLTAGSTEAPACCSFFGCIEHADMDKSIGIGFVDRP